MARTFTLVTPEGNGITADLDEEGVVAFAVAAGAGSSLRGTELFNHMMDYFGGEVRAIDGVWRKGFLGRPSSNIDKVNELTGNGIALADAITQTWTVTR